MTSLAQNHSAGEETVVVELPAPPGWKKKLVPKKAGTPRKGDIIFIAPTGENITNRRQLEQYLKLHPGGPATSDFHWSTCETTRRSARIIEKVKASPPIDNEPPKKRSRNSFSSKKENEDVDSTNQESKSTEVEMQETEANGSETVVEKDSNNKTKPDEVEVPEQGKNETDVSDSVVEKDATKETQHFSASDMKEAPPQEAKSAQEAEITYEYGSETVAEKDDIKEPKLDEVEMTDGLDIVVEKDVTKEIQQDNNKSSAIDLEEAPSQEAKSVQEAEIIHNEGEKIPEETKSEDVKEASIGDGQVEGSQKPISENNGAEIAVGNEETMVQPEVKESQEGEPGVVPPIVEEKKPVEEEATVPPQVAGKQDGYVGQGNLEGTVTKEPELDLEIKNKDNGTSPPSVEKKSRDGDVVQNVEGSKEFDGVSENRS